MAESKQYITRMQENGRVMISEDVIATIALQALKEIEGFAGLENRPGSEFSELIGKKNKGIKVTITEKNRILIDCNVLVYYGQSVMDMAQTIQQAVSAAVESTTSSKVLNVNVNICGIVRQ